MMQKELRMFSHVSQTIIPRNKLDKAIIELFKSNSRKVIHREAGIELFKEKFLKDIDALNQKFSRCTPRKPYWFEIGKGDYALFGAYIGNFYLYKVCND